MADREALSWRAVWVGEDLSVVPDSLGRPVCVDEPGWHIVSDGDGPHGYPVVLRLDGVGHEGDPSVAEWVAGLLSAATSGGVRLSDVLSTPQLGSRFGSPLRRMVVDGAASALGLPDPLGAYDRRDDERMRVVLTR